VLEIFARKIVLEQATKLHWDMNSVANIAVPSNLSAPNFSAFLDNLINTVVPMDCSASERSKTYPICLFISDSF